MSDITRFLSQIESGDQSAAELLLPLVYDELRKLAATRMAQEKPGQTLQRRRWCMKPICGWLGTATANRGKAGDISLLRLQKRCGTYWWLVLSCE